MPTIDFRFNVTNKEAIKRLYGPDVLATWQRGLDRGSTAVAEKVLALAKARCPVRQTPQGRLGASLYPGFLRDSGYVKPGTPTRYRYAPKVGFSAPYAFWVHERLDLRHPVGQAKFLESALLDMVPQFEQALAEAVRAQFASKR